MLTGLNVSGDTDDTLQVTVATDLGTLALLDPSGVDLAYGNSLTGDTSITFTGLQEHQCRPRQHQVADGGATTGTAHIALTASVADPDPDDSYLSSNQHIYRYVPSENISWYDADAQAKTYEFAGQHGYLATIPNDTVNDFLSYKVPGAVNVWFGAWSDTDEFTDDSVRTVDGTVYPRVWHWAAGDDESPIAGNVISLCSWDAGTCDFVNNDGLYSSWSDGEPNNYGSEWAAVTNWGGVPGKPGTTCRRGRTAPAATSWSSAARPMTTRPSAPVSPAS